MASLPALDLALNHWRWRPRPWVFVDFLALILVGFAVWFMNDGLSRSERWAKVTSLPLGIALGAGLAWISHWGLKEKELLYVLAAPMMIFAVLSTIQSIRALDAVPPPGT